MTIAIHQRHRQAESGAPGGIVSVVVDAAIGGFGKGLKRGIRRPWAA